MNRIDDILAKHFSGLQLSPDEQIILDNWLLKHQKEFDVLKATMEAKVGNKYEKFDTKKGWEKISKRMDQPSKLRFSIKPILKYSIAASIAILIGLVGFKFISSSSQNMLVFENKTNTADSLQLPDGTKIFLAPNSKIEYAKNFEQQRNIKLDGKAFFDVFRDENNPFIIQTTYGDVKVLGTSFNVNTFGDKTKVDVKSGLVALSINKKEIKLSKNESAWSDGVNISEKSMANPNFLSWKTGQFYFDNTPIMEVVKFLEAFFGDVIDTQFENKDCSFTGSFKNQNLDGIIEALVLSCNLEFSKENNRFTLN